VAWPLSLEPEDHADLRSQAAARDAEYCGADFDLMATMAYARAAVSENSFHLIS
jgi:hypothetical protein